MKRSIIIAFILLLVLFISGPKGILEGTAATVRYDGDVNSDGKITASDARLALRLAVGLERYAFTRKMVADIDYDGEVTASDARSLLRMAVDLDRKQKYSDPVRYANEYFSLTFPASWRGHFFVQEETVSSGGTKHVAYWICNTDEYPHYKYSPDYVVCFIDVIPGDQNVDLNETDFNLFRYIETKNAHYSLHFYMHSPENTGSLQGSQASYIDQCAQMPGVLKTLRAGTAGYPIRQYDYSGYMGSYIEEHNSPDSVYSVIELDILKTEGPVLYFTYGLYSQFHVNQVENGAVVITNGKGRCYVVDGWGYSLEMNFRLRNGKVYVTVSGRNGDDRSTLITRRGEKELSKMK